MNNFTISFYDEFKCSAESCPSTCCRGWLVPIDDESYKKYITLPLKDSLKARLLIRKHDGYHVFNKYMSTCPFYEKDHLCHFHKNYGADYLCKVCASYPRIECNYGVGASRFLDLSCPTVAEDFLSHLYDAVVINTDIVSSVPLYGTNDDASYFSFITKLREYLETIIKDTRLSLPAIFNNLIKISQDIQNIFASESMNTDTSAAINKALAYLDSYEVSDNEYAFSSEAIDKVMTGGYYHMRVKRESPLLYKLSNKYFKLFGPMYMSDIDALYRDLLVGNISFENAEYPVVDILRKYLWYMVNSFIYLTYEDYSFMRRIITPILKCQLLGIFIYLYSADSKSSRYKVHMNKKTEPLNLNKETLSLVISAFSRRGSGPDGIYSDFFNIIYNYLPS